MHDSPGHPSSSRRGIPPGTKYPSLPSDMPTRRTFLGAALAGAGFLAAPRRSYGAPSSNGRPFATCRKGIKLVGVYCSPGEVLNHPEYLDDLQNKLGVNTVILHGSGVKYPRDILALAPFPQEKKQWVGVGYTDDDSALDRAAEILHERHIDMWLSGSGHYDLGNDDTLATVDFDGRPLRTKPVPKYATESGAPLCFQKRRVMDWQSAAYGWIAKRYDIDALYMSHHRYTIPALYTGLSGCACGDCESTAGRLGYDFEHMKSAVKAFPSMLGTMTKERIASLATGGTGFTDFLQTFRDGVRIVDWLSFRAAAVTDSFANVRRAVRSASSGRCAFVIDTVNPAFSLLVGHDLSTFAGEASDAVYSMSWVDHHYINVAASWANLLCERIRGLDESPALRAVYALVGWDDIDLPRDRIADLHIGETGKTHDPREFHRYFAPYLAGLMTHEFRRGNLMNIRSVPSYQTVFPFFWGRGPTDPIMEAVMREGHDGYFFEISPEPYVKRPA